MHTGLFHWTDISQLSYPVIHIHSDDSGQQIRSEIGSFQNAYFLISQPNPMM